MVRGCLAWQRDDDLQVPAAVTQSTQQYRDEMDTLAPFLEECCLTGQPDHVKVKAPFLASAYHAWCKRTGERPLGNNELIAALEERGYQRQRGTGNQYYWHGIGLANAEDARYETSEKVGILSY